MDKVVDAVLLLPIESVKVAPATEMVPIPELVFAVGVNTRLYSVEEVEVSAPIVPPVTVMSPTTKSVAASDSVNVMVSVWPERSVPVSVRASVTVGANVS